MLGLAGVVLIDTSVLFVIPVFEPHPVPAITAASENTRHIEWRKRERRPRVRVTSLQGIAGMLLI